MPNFEIDTPTGVLFCTYEVCKMNFTNLSCYLSMPFTKTHTLMQKTNKPLLIFAGCGFGWLPRSGGAYLDALRSFTAGAVKSRSHAGSVGTINVGNSSSPIQSSPW